jgi:PKHD-type hydroxylase
MFWFEPPDQLINWEYNVKGALDNLDIELIENYVNTNQSQLKKAGINISNSVPYQNEYRRSDILFLTDYQAVTSVYEKIHNIVTQVNMMHFKFSLCYTEPFQYSVYKEEELGFYDVHCDSNLRNTSGFSRKLSFSILLNDTSEFEGGNLLLNINQNPVELVLNKGDMVLFPSFLPHSVSPVTKGIRRSLVGWFCGPNFV